MGDDDDSSEEGQIIWSLDNLEPDTIERARSAVWDVLSRLLTWTHFGPGNGWWAGLRSEDISYPPAPERSPIGVIEMADPLCQPGGWRAAAFLIGMEREEWEGLEQGMMEPETRRRDSRAMRSRNNAFKRFMLGYHREDVELWFKLGRPVNPPEWFYLRAPMKRRLELCRGEFRRYGKAGL